MNELKVFQNSEFGELGVLIIDDKEFFPASQCAKILGYTNPRDAIKRHCKSEGVVKHDGVSYTTNQHGFTSQQITEIKYISEGNLYRLIIRSKLPSAEEFERWVFDEVLPELRKNGSYGNNFNLEEVIAKTATAVVSEVLKQIIPTADNPTEQSQNVSKRSRSLKLKLNIRILKISLKFMIVRMHFSIVIRLIIKLKNIMMYCLLTVITNV